MKDNINIMKDNISVVFHHPVFTGKHFETMLQAVILSPTSRGEPQRAHSDLRFEMTRTHVTFKDEQTQESVRVDSKTSVNKKSEDFFVKGLVILTKYNYLIT